MVIKETDPHEGNLTNLDWKTSLRVYFQGSKFKHNDISFICLLLILKPRMVKEQLVKLHHQLLVSVLLCNILTLCLIDVLYHCWSGKLL